MTKPVSNYASDELIVATDFSVRRNAVKVSVPMQLAERRIYLYLEAKQSGAPGGYQFALSGKIIAKSQGRNVGEFPATIANFIGQNPNKSVASLLNAGGTPIGDSLVLQLANPFINTVTSIVIQPLRINAEIDEVVFDMDSFTGDNLQGWRVYLGVLSTQF